MPAGTDILTVEFKTNLLAPAKGESFAFRAAVVKPGRTLTICEARAYAVHDGVETLIATMSADDDGAAAPRAGQTGGSVAARLRGLIDKRALRACGAVQLCAAVMVAWGIFFYSFSSKGRHGSREENPAKHRAVEVSSLS